MRKIIATVLVLFVYLITINVQGQTTELRIIKIDKNLSDYKNQYDLSTPLKSIMVLEKQTKI